MPFGRKKEQTREWRTDYRVNSMLIKLIISLGRLLGTR